MDVGARHLGMPDGMLTRLVGERLYWKVVITFQISEPRGGKPKGERKKPQVPEAPQGTPQRAEAPPRLGQETKHPT